MSLLVAAELEGLAQGDDRELSVPARQAKRDNLLCLHPIVFEQNKFRIAVTPVAWQRRAQWHNRGTDYESTKAEACLRVLSSKWHKNHWG